MNIGFDKDRYIKLQSKNIRKRIEQFDNKLYLEFGGKLFDDFHASRVLPGFEPDIKLRLLMELSKEIEIIITINAKDIEKNKVRGDLGITYDIELLRLIDVFKRYGLYVGSVVITQYTGQPGTDLFKERLTNLGIDVYTHYIIEDYPSDISNIVSEKGFGKNEYIKTTKPLIVLTAPGPGSGKMATCLSQLYHDQKRGIRAGYAKFETFPIWNLSLKHPINLAYEAATADLNDINMIDPYHLENYGETVVSYNRDVEIFPVLKAMFEMIYGKSPYNSPTDMGVNMAGFCICNDEVCKEASKQEIIRRYYDALNEYTKGRINHSVVYRIELLMKQLELKPEDRPVVNYAMEKAEKTGFAAAAMELSDGHIITGKTSDLLGPSAALILNALKYLAGIEDPVHLISPTAIEPIQKLKTNYLGSKNPRLHIDETLIALSISAARNEKAQLALDQVPKLKGAQVHVSSMLGSVDRKLFAKLGIQTTCEAVFEDKPIYI
ncbi:MAG: DUF1846 domain-containing protein [Lagierella massiliensis]|nr:DUF1846 domain-containing protein [Lagierella massiliensis]